MKKYFLDSPFKPVEPPVISEQEYQDLLKYPHHFGLESLNNDIDLLVINNDSVNKHFVINALVSGINVVVCQDQRVCGFKTGLKPRFETQWFFSEYKDPRIKKLEI